MEYRVRDMTPAEYPLLADFCIWPSLCPRGSSRRLGRYWRRLKCRYILKTSARERGIEAWWQRRPGKLVGAAWARIMEDYGHVDDDTPSLAAAVEAPYRGQGIGGALLRALLDQLAQAGYRRASLSVQKENPAAALYRRLGVPPPKGNQMGA